MESSSSRAQLRDGGTTEALVHTDSKGSLPSSLKLFAQLRHGPGKALSLWAGLTTPRVPCSLRVEPRLRAALVPHPPGISLYRPKHSRRHPGLGHAQMRGWIPGQNCAPRRWRSNSGNRQGAVFRARPEAAHPPSAKVRAQPRCRRPESEWASGTRGSALAEDPRNRGSQEGGSASLASPDPSLIRIPHPRPFLLSRLWTRSGHPPPTSFSSSPAPRWCLYF